MVKAGLGCLQSKGQNDIRRACREVVRQVELGGSDEGVGVRTASLIDRIDGHRRSPAHANYGWLSTPEMAEKHLPQWGCSWAVSFGGVGCL